LEVQRLNDQRRLVAKANDKSDRIIAQLRRQKLGEIFERMDGDRDGEISHSKIDDVLSLELRNAFRPLLGELEQLQQPLDKEEFIDAGMRLYNTLS
jgi:Ca2+-binding EF-hand superfamily protein